MKKILFILCLFSMTAHAQWKYDGGSDSFDSYIDYSRIKTEGRYKSMWYMADFKAPQTNSSGKMYKSTVAKRVVDCQASRTQIVVLYQYSEQMGRGALVVSANYAIEESDWQYPPPNSFNDGYIKIACATNNSPKPPVIPKPPVNNAQDIKRQRCINLGLAPNSTDFLQCMN
jgi:hypothetical protein